MGIFRSFINTTEKLQGNEKILLIDYRRIGDSLMSFSILEALKQAYPSIHLSMILEKATHPLIQGNPYIDDYFVFDEKATIKEHFNLLKKLRHQKFDICLDVMGMPKSAVLSCLIGAPMRLGAQAKRRFFYTHLYTDSARHPYSAFNKLNILKLISAYPTGTLPLPRIVINEEEITSMRKKLSPADSFFSTAPSTRTISKQLWQPEQWAELYDLLIESYKLPIAITSAPVEKPFIKDILSFVEHKDMILEDLPVKNIRDLAVLASMSKLHISGDNGSKHIANFVQTPCVTLWNYLSPIKNFAIPEERQTIPDKVLWARDYMNQTNDGHRLTVNIALKTIQSIFDWHYEDSKIQNYQSHSGIKFDIAV